MTQINQFNGKKILLIITGSVACYKSIELIRLLKKNSYEVNCILTKGAKEFITPLLVSAISGTQTFDELFSSDDEIKMGHINLSRENDLIVIAPASADFIAKIAHGYADDLASATILASNKKIFIAPAMNQKMWDNNITQNNIHKILNQKDFKIINPEKDILACGEEGFGKMASPQQILDEINNFFTNKDLLKNKNILITLGATHEPIDPVRFIGNSSSGKQGLAIAKTLHEMGANVSLIIGHISEKIDFMAKNISFAPTATLMLEEVKKHLNNQARCDIFIGCSAVADYRVKNYSPQKIKKTSQQNLTLELERNPDILDFVGKATNRPNIVIGFCAESDNLLENARTKLINKNCDLIVANAVNNGKIFGSDTTSGLILNRFEHQQNFDNISKIELSYLLINKINNITNPKQT